MNIHEGMMVKTLEGVRGFITKVEMKSHNGEVWYDLRIKPDDIGDRFGAFVSKRIEWHGLEKEMYKHFESIGGERLQVVSMDDFRSLQEQVVQLIKRIEYLERQVHVYNVLHSKL